MYIQDMYYYYYYYYYFILIIVVLMPSDQYRLELTNSTVCSLDRVRSRATGMVIGDTQIVLHDKSKFIIIH